MMNMMNSIILYLTFVLHGCNHKHFIFSIKNSKTLFLKKMALTDTQR